MAIVKRRGFVNYELSENIGNNNNLAYKFWESSLCPHKKSRRFLAQLDYEIGAVEGKSKSDCHKLLSKLNISRFQMHKRTSTLESKICTSVWSLKDGKQFCDNLPS